MEKQYKSKNGISVFSYKNTALHGFYISLFVRAGNMYEQDDENGITHFLEHIAVRNINALHGGALYSTLDRLGLEFNASTYNEMVQFYISGASKNIKYASEIIAELLSPISLSPSEINTERQRVRAEIREGDERTSLTAFSNKIVFEGTPLARPIIGTGKTVAKFTAKRLEEYRRRVFTSENIFFYITGNYGESDIEYLISEIDRYHITSGNAGDNSAALPKSFFNRTGEVYVKNADFTMARFTFDIDMSRVGMQKSDLLYDILLSGYSSDFFIELSEKRGLFYDLTGSVERYKNIGTLTFSYELSGKKLYEAVEMTVEILNSLKLKSLPEDRMMKAGYTDNATMLFDDIRELNFTFSYDNHIMGLGYSTVDDRIKAYQSITSDELRSAAKEIFKVENLTLTIKGNAKTIDKKRLSEIIRRLG